MARKIILKGKELETFIFNSTYSFINAFIANWEVNKKLIDDSLEVMKDNKEDKGLIANMLTIAAYYAKNSSDNIDFMIAADMWKPAKEGWAIAYDSVNWKNYTQVGFSQEDIHAACATFNLSRLKKEKALKIAQQFNQDIKNVK